MLPRRGYPVETRSRRDASADPDLLEAAEAEGEALVKGRTLQRLPANSTNQAVVQKATSASSVTEGVDPLRLDAKTLEADRAAKEVQPRLPSLPVRHREDRVLEATNRVNPKSALQRSRREAEFLAHILPGERASSEIDATTLTLLQQLLLLVGVNLAAKVVKGQRARRKRKRKIRRAVAPQPLLLCVL